MRRALTAVLCLIALNAAAGSITSLNPSSIKVESGEEFLTIAGTDLGDIVVMDGPAGRFELEVSAKNPTATEVVNWIPLEVVNTPGTYLVSVHDQKGESNVVKFFVNKPGRGIFKIHLPELLLAPAKSRLGAYIRYEVTATDAEGGVEIKCDPESGAQFPFGTSTIRCFGSDGSGQKDEGEISVNVFDSVAPSIEVPKDFEVPGESQEGTVVKFDTRAIDEIDGDVAVDCLPKSESLFPNGRTHVNCIAYDLSLNPNYGSFDVMVRPKDTGRLELRLPEPFKEPAQFKEGAYVEFEVTAYGSADPDPVVTCDPASGSFFEVGRHKVICTAVDDFDQRAEGAFEFEVSEFEDLKFEDVNAEATSPSGAEVSFEPAVEGWTAEIACSPASGSLFAIGTTTVDCESTEEGGRRAIGSFTVLVADTIAPHIASIEAKAGLGGRDSQVVPVEVAVQAIDMADAMPQCSISNFVNESGGAFDWRVRTDLEAEVNADPGAHRLFRIQVTCVDAAGNRATGDVALTVPASRGHRVKTN